MTKLMASAGKFDFDVVEIMTEARQPVFVDNAVHHGLVSSQTSNKQKVTIENRNNATYNVFSENAYELVEGDGFVQLTHKRGPGYTSKIAPFYQNSALSPTSKKPILLYNDADITKRLTFSSIEPSTDGVKMNLRNMKGRSLNDIGLKGDAVHLGDPIDVGFRTSDLAMKLGTDMVGTLTSVSLGSLRSPSNTNEGRRKHTTKFLAQDFYGVTLISALKFTSRHDSNIVYFDRFANLLYTPLVFTEASREISEFGRTGNEETNPIDNTENKITVVGNSISLNEVASVTVSDSERQQGRFDLDIQENVTNIFDATVKSKADAKRVARQILKSNAIHRGSLRSSGHPDTWDMRPGKVALYKGVKRLITESRHTLTTRMSDFNFLTVQKGIEGVLHGVSEGMIASSAPHNPDKISQTTEENLSLFSFIQINIIPIISVRAVEVENTKFLIGPAAGSATIGRSHNNVIGVNKLHTLTFKGED
jgi:hypothetical protein